MIGEKKIKYPLVSIITPCYNGENYVHRFLDSVLLQTYPNIELIFINDGSTDKTEDIVLSYSEKFKAAGIHFKYFSQENKGQAAAINVGLKHFKGEYLTWPDSDDILNRNNISMKVDYLEQHKDCGMVLCKTCMVSEDNINKVLGILERKVDNEDHLFYDIITENNVYCAPGGYMVRTKALLEVIPDKHIYESRSGQNWQILLPMAYYYKCGYINEILYTYLIRGNSHSRQEKTLEEQMEKTYRHEEVLQTVITQMKIPDEKFYLDIVQRKYIRKRFLLSFQYRNKVMLKEFYNELTLKNMNAKKDYLMYHIGINPIFFCLYKIGSILRGYFQA